jgi:hypothetical protein
MRARQHALLLMQAIAVWAAFWLAGRPDYFQQYATVPMAVACTLLSALFGLFALFLLARVRSGRRMNRALWLSFYYSVPLFVLDWLYCGVYLGLGLDFLRSHWYLTVFYVSIWLQFPPTAWLLDRLATAPTASPHGARA